MGIKKGVVMKFLTITSAFLFSFSAEAADYCTRLAMDAEQIMSGRQRGLDVEYVTQVFRHKYRGDQLFLARTMIKDAYASPVFTLHDEKLKAVRSYGMRWYKKCERFQDGY